MKKSKDIPVSIPAPQSEFYSHSLDLDRKAGKGFVMPKAITLAIFLSFSRIALGFPGTDKNCKTPEELRQEYKKNGPVDDTWTKTRNRIIEQTLPAAEVVKRMLEDIKKNKIDVLKKKSESFTSKLQRKYYGESLAVESSIRCPDFHDPDQKVVPSRKKKIETSENFLNSNDFVSKNLSNLGIGGFRHRYVLGHYLTKVNLLMPVPLCEYDSLITLAGPMLPESWNRLEVEENKEGRAVAVKACALVVNLFNAFEKGSAVPVCKRMSLDEIRSTEISAEALANESVTMQGTPESEDQYVQRKLLSCKTLFGNYLPPNPRKGKEIGNPNRNLGKEITAPEEKLHVEPSVDPK